MNTRRTSPVVRGGLHLDVSQEVAAIRAARLARPKRRVSYRRKQRLLPYAISLNLTAMIDTVFNLLFLFIIISRFGAMEGTLPAKLPLRTTAAAVAEVPRTPIRVRLWVDPRRPEVCQAAVDRFFETPQPIASLAANLQKIREMNVGFDGDTPVHLIAGPEVIWDHVVNAYNAAMVAQYARIYLAWP